VIAGTASINLSLPIALAITALLAVVIISYSQLIRAYPAGGGAYIVAMENLGRVAGIVAGAALLIDYTLTVSVSIAASVEAIVSAAPGAHDFAVPLAVALVGVIALGNLRGVRESGTVFAIPTYGFVFILGATIVGGMVKVFLSDDPNILETGDPQRHIEQTGNVLMWFLVLRAFSAGCAALTGVEAISVGVSAFKPPEWRNAIITLAVMGLLLGFLFLGTTLLARTLASSTRKATVRRSCPRSARKSSGGTCSTTCSRASRRGSFSWRRTPPSTVFHSSPPSSP